MNNSAEDKKQMIETNLFHCRLSVAIPRTLLAIASISALATASHSFEVNGTKWGMGPNVAAYLQGNEGTPGSFTWSIMRNDLGFSGYESHSGLRTVEFGTLLGTSSQSEEIAAITSALSKWSAVCNLSIVGPISDCGLDGGAPEALGAHVAEMRFGAVHGGFGGAIAHAYQPGNESIYGAGGSITGDIHFSNEFQWIDNPNHVFEGWTIFDFETVMLHEIGHSLGLTHTNVPGSVMFPEYVGAKRELRPDDIAGIQHIYGPVPEPATLLTVGFAVLGLIGRRKTRIHESETEC